jgi:bifunctional UDP-N-acetylglucosamine pyrophosphorylase / glucosamine-1-phosphate N-acetyltransferase
VERLLVIPAAGTGSRLGAALPKVLVPVAGRPMLDHLLALYEHVAQQVVLVVAPAAVAPVQDAVRGWRHISRVVQETATGMLDAIMLARAAVEATAARRVLITWCDQVGISPATVAAVAAASARDPEPALVMPVCRSRDPYVHLERDDQGRIVRVLHRREGDAMPASGESDAGVFDLSRQAYLEWLPQYAQSPDIGAKTGERNFVPFVAAVSARAPVVTVPCAAPEEAIGINTPSELQAVERYLTERTSP